MLAVTMCIPLACWVQQKFCNELKDEWEGTVKLIFQPGEERNPGGASFMIKEGALENPRPQGIFGLHVHPGLPVGKFSFRKGQGYGKCR